MSINADKCACGHRYDTHHFGADCGNDECSCMNFVPEIKPAPKRNGSPHFYKLVEEMSDTHDRKSYDYASNDNPFGNYHFAGELSKLFNNPKDAGFVGRIGEKLYRLANLENAGKSARNETIQDTEVDICTIVVLWMADRRSRREDGK